MQTFQARRCIFFAFADFTLCSSNFAPIIFPMLNEPLLELELPGVKKVKSGKVREIFDLGQHLLFVATDRISAFDCVMPNGIPRKGEVLTQLSYFWFDLMAPITANHLAAGPTDPLPPELQKYSDLLSRR